MEKTKKIAGKNQKTAYLFILPSMIVLTVFVFIPLVSAFVISMMNMDLYMKDITFAGIGNYLKMFQDARVLNATKEYSYIHCNRSTCSDITWHWF